MKLRFFASAIAALGLAAISSTANAATSITYGAFDPYQVALPTNETLITQFEGGPGLINVRFLQAGYGLSGTGVLFTGSTAGVSLAPAFTASFRDPTQYLSVQGSKSVLLTTPGIRGISLYFGTVDSYNNLKFFYSDSTTETVAGPFRTIAPRTSSGQTYTGQDRDGRLHVEFNKSLVGVEVSSSGNTFEISDFAVRTAVPEPTSWALMITGFGAAGAMLRRRRAVAA